MPRDSNGNTQPLGGTIVSTGDPILPSQHNPALVDLYEMMSQSLSRDGQGGMRANLNMNGYRIINVATSSASGDLATVGLVNSTVDTKVNAAVANKVNGDWITTVGLVADNPSSPYMRRSSNNSIVELQTKLGFTPIQQGGGTGQGTNKIRIGWGGSGVLMLQVDNLNFSSTWPINISGTATVTNNQVMSQIAASVPGTVGSYAFAQITTGSQRLQGETIAGSELAYCSADGIKTSSAMGGTWRCMGQAIADGNKVTLWLRIS